MNEPQALKVEDEIRGIALKQPGVWMTVSKEMRPELRMIKIEVSIKVDENVVKPKWNMETVLTTK